MPQIRIALMFLWIALLPLQDSILQATPLSSFGASLSFIPLLALMLLGVVEWTWRGEWTLRASTVVVGAYVIVLTLYYLVVFGPVSHEINLVVRSVLFAVTFGVFLFPIFSLTYESGQVIRRAAFLAVGLALMGMLLGDFNLVSLRPLVDNPVLHYTRILDLRPRSFCTESSSLSVLLGSMGLLCVHLAARRSSRALLLLFTAGAVLLTRSKGGVIALVVTFAIVAALFVRRVSWLKLAAAGAGLVAVATIAAQILQRSVATGVLLETTTFGTRPTLLAWSFVTLAHHPLGVGFSGFLPAMKLYIPAAVDLVYSLGGIPLNFSEVIGYVASPEYVSAKTIFANLLAMFGLPFLAAFVWFHRRLICALRRQHQVWLLAAVVFAMVAVCTYIDNTGFYAISLVYGIAWQQSRAASAPETPDPAVFRPAAA